MPALILRDLRKVYDNGRQALRGIDLEVQKGDFFALLGPNGAGKSTAIGIICSLVRKTSGNVRVFGYDLDQTPELVKRCLGLVPQEFNFNQFQPVEEIIINQAGYYGIPRREARVRAEHYLRQLELWDSRRLPARELSGGMKRRLMIARALAHRPQLLILDEPTAGVDIELRRAMWVFLREINAQGTTIILTTHYLEEAESLCRHIGIIYQGQLIECASLNTVLGRLQHEVFILNLRKSLTAPLQLEGFKIQQLDARTLEVTVTQEHGMNVLFENLSFQGIEVVSLRNKQNRLEQLFIDMLTACKTSENTL